MDETGPQAYDSNENMSQHQFRWSKPTIRQFNWPVYLLTIALLVIVLAGSVYLSGERQQRRDLLAANQRLTASVALLQGQVQAVSERMSDLLARAAAPPQAPVPAPALRSSVRVHPPGTQRMIRNDAHIGEIQRQLSEQRKEITSARADIEKTRNDLNQTRNDLQNNISSAKDTLNGSIARTHNEVVALQKRGERNYYEFAIDKSKHYSRIGPLSIGLRKADTKHKRFDMMLLVDDDELQKKSVNLYETVWISLADSPQPLELVVNRIAKDHIEGYLSEPKYKKSELQSSASANATGNSTKPINPTLPQ